MIRKYRITFKNHQTSSVIMPDQSIMESIINENIDIPAPCGGKGICKKCLIKLISGKVSGNAINEENIYIACQTKALSDCVIEIINHDNNVIFSKNNLSDNMTTQYKFNKSIFKTCIRLFDKITTDSTPYYQRLLSLLAEKNSSFSIPKAQIPLNQLQQIPQILEKTDSKITVTTDLEHNIIHIEAGNKIHSNYGLAIDLGTTTIDAILVDLNTGKIISNRSMYNTQKKYGADVISRIVYSYKNNALNEIQASAIESINQLIESFQQEFSLDYQNIYKVVISGNTTMTHFLLGVDPDSIRKQPYVPIFNMINAFKSDKVRLKTNSNTMIYTLPCISSYIGGDICAGILSSQLYSSSKLKLLIDIGTNGELVLGNSDWMVACSCSAGPAFEGANISCGTRARQGAIQTVSIDRNTLEPEISTINNALPCGLCGSAIIDLLAELLATKIIDRQGKINHLIKNRRIRKKANIYEYVVAFKEDYNIHSDITIDENDIINVIRAKGAIFAGVTILLKSVDLTCEDIDKIIIAGAFGKYINFKNAIKIGLLPDIDIKKFEYSGNLSLMGSYKYLCDYNVKNDIDYIAENTTNLELSENQEFMSLYAASLFLPHTDLNLFPSVT